MRGRPCFCGLDDDEDDGRPKKGRAADQKGPRRRSTRTTLTRYIDIHVHESRIHSTREDDPGLPPSKVGHRRSSRSCS
jgi:hypothetical protein